MVAIEFENKWLNPWKAVRFETKIYVRCFRSQINLKLWGVSPEANSKHDSQFPQIIYRIHHEESVKIDQKTHQTGFKRFTEIMLFFIDQLKNVE